MSVVTGQTSTEAVPSPLRVLIVGGREALDRSRQILVSLTTMGYEIKLLGLVLIEPHGSLDQLGADPAIPIFSDYTEIIDYDPPDLLILTSDDHLLRKKLVEIIPPETRVLDSFALKAFQTLEKVSGQLGTTRNRLQSVELIKEVLMAGSEVSIMVIDEEFKVIDINNAILQRAQMSKEGCIGRTCHWVIHRYIEPCEVKGSSCPVAEVLRTQRSNHHVREFIKEDGTTRYFTVSAYPLRPDERGKRCVLIVWKDVTKGMTGMLDRQARNIRENFASYLQQDKLVALGKLAAAAVHEINNPIQGILVFAKLMSSSLEGGSLAPEQVLKFRQYLDLIAEESTRCGQILRNLLSFSRHGDLKKSSFDFGALLNEIRLLVGNRMELQGINFSSAIPPDLLPVYGDRNQIKQAVLNLVLNSVEAMPDGGAIDVSAGLDSDRHQIRIRVCDTGGGIPKEIQGSLFEPFITTKKDGKGVGLGLSVVYGIVTQHGGSIEVESDEGQGACVVLSLPVLNVKPGDNSC